MSEWQQLEPYLRDLRTSAPPERDPVARAARRQRILPGLRDRVADAHARQQRFHVWRRIGLGALAVGAVTAIILAVAPVRPRDPQPTAEASSAGDAGVGLDFIKGSLVLNHGGRGRGLTAGEDVVVGMGDSLETPASDGAQVLLSDVAALTLLPGTRVAEIGASAGRVERITLTRGRVHLWVTKLQTGRRFHVLTPGADIEVRGTDFDVELGPGPSPRTCVRVQEGLVLVTAGSARELLSPGRSWGCELPSGGRAATTAPPHRTASDLKVQNALFQRALGAERAGRYAAAVETYRRLLGRYPDGPLAAQAEANLRAMPNTR